jgi:hypothetical protein
MEQYHQAGKNRFQGVDNALQNKLFSSLTIQSISGGGCESVGGHFWLFPQLLLYSSYSSLEILSAQPRTA